MRPYGAWSPGKVWRDAVDFRFRVAPSRLGHIQRALEPLVLSRMNFSSSESMAASSLIENLDVVSALRATLKKLTC